MIQLHTAVTHLFIIIMIIKRNIRSQRIKIGFGGGPNVGRESELQRRFTQTNVPNKLMIDYIFAWNVLPIVIELINGVLLIMRFVCYVQVECRISFRFFIRFEICDETKFSVIPFVNRNGIIEW